MNYAGAAQRAVFTALSGGISCPVYDAAPYLPEGAPASGFPYVVIGDDTTRAWDHDTRRGADVTVTVHIWSRAEGFKEAKDIAGQIYDRLHRQVLTSDGFAVVDCLWEFADFMRDGDGKTRHGVTRYRLIIQEQ